MTRRDLYELMDNCIHNFENDKNGNCTYTCCICGLKSEDMMPDTDEVICIERAQKSIQPLFTQIYILLFNILKLTGERISNEDLDRYVFKARN